MECHDHHTNVNYRHHDEFVAADGPRGRALGFCARCGEVTDVPCCVRAARDGFSRAADALVAAGLMSPTRYAVEIVGRFPRGKEVRERVGGLFQTRAAAENAAAPGNWETGPGESVEVVEVPGALIGAAAAFA